MPVNKAKARTYFLVAAGGAGVVGVDVWFTLADIWDQVLELSEHLGRKESFEHVELLHYLSVALAGAAAVLLLGVLVGLLDAQFFYHLATDLLLVAFTVVVLAWFTIPGDSSMVLKAMFMAVIVFALILTVIWAVSPRGMVGYYLRERSYGDVAVAVFELALVVALMGYSVSVFWRA